jgi:hypothetical protein
MLSAQKICSEDNEMGNLGFEKAATEFVLNPAIVNPVLALKGILDLYHRIEDWSLQAEAKVEELHDDPETESENQLSISILLHKIQQMMTIKPLGYFLNELATDDHIPIRCAAKGNLAEISGKYMDDPEIAIIGKANIMVSWQSYELQVEIFDDEDIINGMMLWQKACPSPDSIPISY